MKGSLQEQFAVVIKASSGIGIATTVFDKCSQPISVEEQSMRRLSVAPSNSRKDIAVREIKKSSAFTSFVHLFSKWALLVYAGIILSSFATVGQAAGPIKIKIDGDIEIAVQKLGHGPIPVVLIHGYSLSLATWDKVVPLFPADKYTTYAYDLRGFGDSSKPDGGFNYRQHTDDLHALLRALKISRAVIIGHSIGGQIGQEFILRYPNEALALVTSGALARSLPPVGYTDAIRARVNSYGTPEQNRKVLEVAVPRYFDPRNVNKDDIELFTAIASKSSTVALKEQLIDIFSAPALSLDQFRAITVPVLVISGSSDPIGTIAQAVALTDVIPGSELAVVERAGHSPMWERPDAWMQRVLPFLDRRLK
jgi:non-heme chloroperoxidase